MATNDRSAPNDRQPFGPGGQTLPARDRDAVRQASSYINRAAGILGVVRLRYLLADSTGLELTELLARLDLLIIRCDQFLAAHPEQ